MTHRPQLLVLLLSLLLISSSASAHTDGMAGSKWFFGKKRMVAVLELSPKLLGSIPGIKEGHYLIGASDPKIQEAVTKVIQPYLDRKLSLVVNGKPYPVQAVKAARQNDLGWEIWIVADPIGFEKAQNQVKIDYRLLFDETDDTHVNLAYMYASDATVGSVPKNVADSDLIDRTDFTSNTRVWEGSVMGAPTVPALSSSYTQRIGEFILYGVKHILTGYDHIAFLLALIAIGLSLKEVLKTVTAFTIAHSVTLLLATLQIVSLNPRLVEIAIALSVCYVALENLIRNEANYRWAITFAFGLIHGFGFASGLRELIVGRSDLVVSVLSFNLGVEIGQLGIILVLVPVCHLLKKKVEFRKITVATSTAVLILGFGWLIERVFNVAVVPSFLS